MKKCRLILFTRFPEPGQVKTRLAPVLGDSGAANIHREMTEHTFNVCNSLPGVDQGLLEIRYTGGEKQQMQSWLGRSLEYVPQVGDNLGERMSHAFAENFQQRKKRVVLIGTDSPQLSIVHLKLAFEALKKHDMVIGPSQDGGYYLLGLKRWHNTLFETIDWGTDKVYDQTIQKAKELGWSVHDLETLKDVDLPEDLFLWDNVVNQYISIVIPTLNEEEYIADTLDRIMPLSYGEVIVVDGGSQDNTVEIAQDWGATVIPSRPSRGVQMNTGARAARGDILLFLHADTQLPQDYAESIRNAMQNMQKLGGYFRLKFAPTSFLLRIKERKIFWRTHYLKLPFGDQAYFVRASVFHQIGRFPGIPIMEDVEFIRNLRRLGETVFLKRPVLTSSRRFLRHGPTRTTWRNKVVFFGYLLGVSPERLAKFYYKGSKQDPP